MRPFLSLALCGSLLTLALGGCSEPRRLQYTFTKKSTSEQQLYQDQDELKKTSGVHQVLTHQDLDGSVTLQLYVLEENPLPGKQAAVDLGYAQVRN